jgi:predicted metal-dependent hydrolase
MDVFDKYMNLIKEERFFDAHEVLEEVWQELRKTDNDIKWAYKGLINAAVALELKKRKREKEVYKKVWNNFEKYRKYYFLDDRILKAANFMEKFKL